MRTKCFETNFSLLFKILKQYPCLHRVSRESFDMTFSRVNYFTASIINQKLIIHPRKENPRKLESFKFFSMCLSNYVHNQRTPRINEII